MKKGPEFKSLIEKGVCSLLAAALLLTTPGDRGRM